MASVVIEGLPDDLLEDLRESAKIHGRTLNSEMLTRLERSRGRESFDVDAFLEDVERLQQRTNLPPLTDEALERAISEGRA